MSQLRIHPGMQPIQRTTSIDARIATMQLDSGSRNDEDDSALGRLPTSTKSSIMPRSSQASLSIVSTTVEDLQPAASRGSKAVARKSGASAAGKGSRKGATNWSNQLIEQLLNAVEEILPLGAYHWDHVVELFNERTGREDDVDRLKHKFLNMANAAKPTGVNIKPEAIARAQQLHGKIEAKACMSEMGYDGREDGDDALPEEFDGEGETQSQQIDDDDDDLVVTQEQRFVESSSSSSSQSSPASSSHSYDGAASRSTPSVLSRQSSRPAAVAFPSIRSSPAKRRRTATSGPVDISDASETMSTSLAAIIEHQSRLHRDEMRMVREQMDRADERAREDREKSTVHFALLIAAITGKRSQDQQ
jgi:hypothetical protein